MSSEESVSCRRLMSLPKYALLLLSAFLMGELSRSVCAQRALFASGGQDEIPATIRTDGTISLPGGVEVPPYSMSGQWAELEKKSSSRYFIRHFMFKIPNDPPAIELFVSRDLTDEPPDGAFEIGLVRGYIRGFSSKAAFSSSDPEFEDRTIGSINVRRCLVQLSNERINIWVYAYIYVRKPSLTFITVRRDPLAGDSIERFLATLQLSSPR